MKGLTRILEGTEVVGKILREWAPVETQTGSNLEKEFVRESREIDPDKAATNVALGRATVFPVTRAEEIVRL